MINQLAEFNQLDDIRLIEAEDIIDDYVNHQCNAFNVWETLWSLGLSIDQVVSVLAQLTQKDALTLVD